MFSVPPGKSGELNFGEDKNPVLFPVHRIEDVFFSHLHHLRANVENYRYLPRIFALALTVSKMYKFQIFHLHKVVKVAACNLTQLNKSTANVKVYKIRQGYRLRDIHFLLFFYLQKVGKSREVQFSKLHHSMANVKM